MILNSKIQNEFKPINKSHKEIIRKNFGISPNIFVYSSVAFIIKFIAKPFFRVEWTIDDAVKKLKPPFIMLGNHPSYLDPFLVGAALYPFKINFLASSTFFRIKSLKTLLRLGGVIPKTQFRADPGAIKSMFSVIKRNGILGIFPEGARSIDGAQLPIEESITKFIKKIGKPVVLCISHGAYLTWPRWSESGFRRGAIKLNIKILFNENDISNLSYEDLHKKLISSFCYNEFEWQKDNNYSYKSKAPAKGLHNILHKCPSCKKDWIMASNGDKIYCKNCSNTAIMNLNGFLHPASETSVIFPTITKWNSWQIDELSKIALLNGYEIFDEANLLISYKEDPYMPSGNGIISLDSKGFTFDGTCKDGKINKHFPLTGILGISSDYGINFDIVSDDNTYRFILKNGQKAISFSHSVEILKKI